MSTSPDISTTSPCPKADENAVETLPISESEPEPEGNKSTAPAADNDEIAAAAEVTPTAESTSEVEACRFFARNGWCKFRRSCRYLHERTEPRHRSKRHRDHGDELSTANKSQTGEDVEDTAVTKEVPGDIESKEPAKDEPKKICYFFKRSGRCKFGTRCRFQHQREKLPDSSSQNQDEDPAEGVDLEAQPRHSKEKTSSEDVAGANGTHAAKRNRRRKLCRYYKAGNCSVGDKCRFRHPKDPLALDASDPEDATEAMGGQEILAEDASRPVADRNPRRQVISRQSQYKLADVSEDELSRLRDTEIEQLKKRYPNGEGEKLGTRYGYQFIFMPSDPDWPYDVKSVPLRFTFPESYPREKLTVSLPEDDVLPDTLRRHLRLTVRDWIQERHDLRVTSGSVELMQRPLLRWIDRNLEQMFTEGLKKYQLELIAQAAGMEFIPASRMQEDLNSDEDVDNQDPEETAAAEENQGPGHDLDDQANTDETQAGDEDKENQFAGNKQAASVSTLDPVKRGIEVKLYQLQFGENVSMLLATKIMLVIQCSRCKNKSEVVTPPERMNSVNCNRCQEEQLVNYRASLAHQFTTVIGYLDLIGCSVFDLILSECQFKLGCLACSKDMIMEGLPPGQPKETWCHHCHQKMKLAVETAKFHQLQPAEAVLDASKAHNVPVKKLIRVLKDPAIQDGKPLPNNGTCKHYKKSFRWLRFPCCGKAYACDLCHDDHETDHEMKFANRMICGYCCREQAYAAEKACTGCHSSLTKKSSAHWEGGKGCRDRVKMSKDDPKKYASTNKTVSRKAHAMGTQGKKTAKA